MKLPNSRIPKSLRGDTLVEVLFAVAIFGMVSVSSIAMMNKGVATAQGTLETAMARQEIDTQAEALRFIHNAYSMNAGDTSNPYYKLWSKLKDKAFKPNQVQDTFLNSANYNGQSCSTIYANNLAILPPSGASSQSSFVINPRHLNNTDLSSLNLDNVTNLERVLVPHKASSSRLFATPTYPRLVYSTTDTTLSDSNNVTADVSLNSAQGIWITAVQEGTGSTPRYYDFYIRTCWENIGGNGSTTISTIVRLYNPDATVISSNTPPRRRG